MIMRKLWLWMVGLVSTLTFVACSEETVNTQTAQLNFAEAKYTLGMDSVIITLEADKAPAADVTVPVSFTGSATMDVDYAVSASSFLLKAGESTAQLVVRRLGEMDSTGVKNITATLTAAPEGYKLGLMSYTEIQLLSQASVLYSFDKPEDVLTMSGAFTLNLEQAMGGKYKVAQDTEFQVSVDPSSTAEEGVHFEFPNGKVIQVAKNQSAGDLQIKCLKAEEGKDLLVINLEPKDGFVAGANKSISIKIQGAYKLAGTWAFDKIANQEWWASSWGLDTTTFPKGTVADRIEFKAIESSENYDFTPQMTSDLKNYFGTGTRVATFQGEREEIMQEEGGLKPSTVNISVLSIPGINVNFSATSQSVRDALVGFRTIKNADGEDVLECTIYDYEPTEGALGELYEMFKDFGDTPAMLSAPLRLHFKRVE